VTSSVNAPGDTNISDATERSYSRLPSPPNTARNVGLPRGFFATRRKKRRLFSNPNPSVLYKYMDLARVHHWDAGANAR